MKHLLLILIFFPLLGFGQIGIYDNGLIIYPNGDIAYGLPHAVATKDTSVVYTPNTVLNVPFKLLPGMTVREADNIGIVADSATILTGYNGDYIVHFQCSFFGGNGITWVFSIRKNGQLVTSLSLPRISTSGANNYVALHWDWYVPGLVVGDDLAFYIKNISGNTDPSFINMTTIIEKIPEK